MKSKENQEMSHKDPRGKEGTANCVECSWEHREEQDREETLGLATLSAW